LKDSLYCTATTQITVDTISKLGAKMVFQDLYLCHHK